MSTQGNNGAWTGETKSGTGPEREKNGAGERTFAERLRLHLANERTFLSWTRTSISLMAFGFVVAKFDLFTKYLVKGGTGGSFFYSGLFGVIFIALGAFVNLGAVIRFMHFKREIEKGGGDFSLLNDYILSLSIFAVAVTLIFYFIRHVAYG